MIVEENVLLATLSTLRVGGVARYVCICESEDDVREAIAFAQERELPWRVLGEGSNILAANEGFPGVVVLMREQGTTYTETETHALVTAAAGVSWDTFVRETAARGLWGIENLAGIPGTVGAAPVQNIGAYGSEVRDTIHSVRVLDTDTGIIEEKDGAWCEFGYRDSRFKRQPSLIILAVTFDLSRDPAPRLEYKDIAVRIAEGADVTTPEKIGSVVREIRAQKFPDLAMCGTAGSFFKNPTITTEAYAKLKDRYPELPGFPNEGGVKVPLAFVLDKILGLRGYQEGFVRLFERQPLVLVAEEGATANHIDVFANNIALRVHDATDITIEREVRTFP